MPRMQNVKVIHIQHSMLDWRNNSHMTFVSIKQAFTALPFFYTKKTEKDIEKSLKKEFPLLAAMPLRITSYYIEFFPSSSLDAQKLLWYRQEIIAFCAEQGIKKQIKIIQ